MSAEGCHRLSTYSSNMVKQRAADTRNGYAGIVAGDNFISGYSPVATDTFEHVNFAKS